MTALAWPLVALVAVVLAALLVREWLRRGERLAVREVERKAWDALDAEVKELRAKLDKVATNQALGAVRR